MLEAFARMSVIKQQWHFSYVMTSLLQASEVTDLLEQLQECNVRLDIVEKGLNDLLDTKKMAFPRCCLGFWCTAISICRQLCMAVASLAHMLHNCHASGLVPAYNQVGHPFDLVLASQPVGHLFHAIARMPLSASFCQCLYILAECHI